MLSKGECRKRARADLHQAFSAEDGCQGWALGQIRHIPAYSSASFLFGYLNMREEACIDDVLKDWLESGKTLLLPRYEEELGAYVMAVVPELSGTYILSGKFGIREPARGTRSFWELAGARQVKPQECIWCVPGLAFDAWGNRLGRGGGFYDRMLASMPGIKVAVALDCQLRDAIPTEPHDVPMDYIMTPTRILDCAAKRK